MKTMRLVKNKRLNLFGVTAGFVFAMTFFAFAYTSQAATAVDTGSGIPILEQQVSPGTQSEPSSQKGVVKCGLKNDDPQTLNINETDPCTFCDFFSLLNNILRWVILTLVPAIALFFMVIGGFLIATSRGNPGQSQKGKDMLIWTFVGIAVILVGWMILNSLLSGIGIMEWTGLQGGLKNGWWQFKC